MKKYFSLSSIDVFVLVSITWIVGGYELYHTLTNFSTHWYWFVIATLYTATLNELFSHRICSHTLFKVDTNSITYKILTYLLTVDLGWSPLTLVCVNHANHHMYADQGTNDNLNPRTGYWSTVCIMSPWAYIYIIESEYPDKEKYYERQNARFSEIIDDPWTQFCEQNRTILTILTWTILYFTIPVVLFKVLLMGRFLLSCFMAMGAIGGHVKLPFGYKNFKTNDQSYNNLIFHYICLGLMSSMLHNNHHRYPAEPKHSHRWFEIDTGYYIVKWLQPLLEKR